MGLSRQTSENNVVGVKAHHTLALRTNEAGPRKCTQILTGKKFTHLANVSLEMEFAHAHLLTTAVPAYGLKVKRKIYPARFVAVLEVANLLTNLLYFQL